MLINVRHAHNLMRWRASDSYKHSLTSAVALCWSGHWLAIIIRWLIGHTCMLHAIHIGPTHVRWSGIPRWNIVRHIEETCIHSEADWSSSAVQVPDVIHRPLCPGAPWVQTHHKTDCFGSGSIFGPSCCSEYISGVSGVVSEIIVAIYSRTGKTQKQRWDVVISQ